MTLELTTTTTRLKSTIRSCLEAGRFAMQPVARTEMQSSMKPWIMHRDGTDVPAVPFPCEYQTRRGHYKVAGRDAAARSHNYYQAHSSYMQCSPIKQARSCLFYAGAFAHQATIFITRTFTRRRAAIKLAPAHLSCIGLSTFGIECNDDHAHGSPHQRNSVMDV